MRITESNISLAATHVYQEETHKKESLQLWVGDRPDPSESAEETPRRNNPGPLDADTIIISAKGLEKQAAARAAKATAIEESASPDEIPEESGVLDPKLEALRRAVEMLTGKKIHIRHFNPHAHQGDAVTTPHQEDQQTEQVGWGLSYDYHASYHEQETTTFSAAGIIKTADGREINFNLELTMQREYSESTDISIRAGDAKLVDPLVINFAGPAAELSDSFFSFDIDNDGSEEQIRQLNSGSGYLALDRNKDGVINDGSELFGPASGNGFTELAGYDSDNNGWLDENDPIFKNLKLWVMDEGGKSYLETLANRGIGALMLNSADTEFRLTDNNNGTLGQIRESSIFVRENGSVGTIQEVDLAV